MTPRMHLRPVDAPQDPRLTAAIRLADEARRHGPVPYDEIAAVISGVVDWAREAEQASREAAHQAMVLRQALRRAVARDAVVPVDAAAVRALLEDADDQSC